MAGLTYPFTAKSTASWDRTDTQAGAAIENHGHIRDFKIPFDKV
jgi:hypothetical protein